jgi:hypothetical protein
MRSGREQSSFNAHYLGEIKVGTKRHRLVDGSVSLVRSRCPRQAYRQIASKYRCHSLVLNYLQSVKRGIQQPQAGLGMVVPERDLSFQAKANGMMTSQGVLFRIRDQPIDNAVPFRPFACPEKQRHSVDPTKAKRDRMVERGCLM